MVYTSCIDLDETLGLFTSIGYQLDGREVPEWEPPTSFRPNTKKVLSELSERYGFNHYLTTAAPRDYAEECLRQAELSENFAAVLSREIINHRSRTAKDYSIVAEREGFSKEEALARMIVIGDAPNDKPIGDITPVFLREMFGWSHDAQTISVIVKSLMEYGDGNMMAGFEKLYQMAKSSNKSYAPARKSLRLDDFDLTLDYLENNESGLGGERTVPTIELYEVPDRFKAER